MTGSDTKTTATRWTFRLRNEGEADINRMYDVEDNIVAKTREEALRYKQRYEAEFPGETENWVLCKVTYSIEEE